MRLDQARPAQAQTVPARSASPAAQTDLEIARAREDFIKEFVATAPHLDKPEKKKQGKVFLAFVIIICSIAELLLIAGIVISALKIGPTEWRFAPVYTVSALICVLLIEQALILVASIIRRNAARPPE
jgi:ABC-type transport system involved in cytochrome bd biosynthesis fused ATPase/permease subunit